MSEDTLAVPQTADIEHIRSMIQNLSEVGESGLRQEMDKLKVALKENPAACELLMPEDIGEMVKHIMKLEGKMIFDAKVKAESKAAKKKGGSDKVNLDPDVLKQMEDEM